MKMAENENGTLVIPGGMVRGVALLGVISELEDIGALNNVSTFVGTSIGSVIGFLLSIGYSSEEILLSAFKNLIEDIQSYLMKSIQELGSRKFLMENDFIVKHIEKMITKKGLEPSITLEQHHNITKKTLICTSYAIDVKDENSETKWNSFMTTPELKCVDALRMSFSVPFFFDFVEIGNTLHVDGGVRENIPWEITEDSPTTMIVLVEPIFRDFGRRTIVRTPIKLQSLNLMIPINVMHDIFRCAKHKTKIRLVKEKID